MAKHKTLHERLGDFERRTGQGAYNPRDTAAFKKNDRSAYEAMKEKPGSPYGPQLGVRPGATKTRTRKGSAAGAAY